MAKLGENGEVIDPQEFQSNQVEVVNISSNNVRFEIEGNRYVLRPGQTVSLHKSYALPRAMVKGKDPVPSVVELLTSKQVLAVTDQRARQVVSAAGARK